MDIMKYTSTLKAKGTEYRNIVFWNRFIRNKTELILSILPALASIGLMIAGYDNSYLLILYAVFWFYPIFTMMQFKSTVAYHLKHRDASESAPCEFTFMETGILAEIEEYNLKYVYHWDDFTTIYNKMGYYMMFNKGTMIVMLRQADMPDGMKEKVKHYMKDNVNQNTCRLML